MYCNKCGKKLYEEDKYCSDCGTQTSLKTSTPGNTPLSFTGPPQISKKPRKALWITIISVTAVILVTATVYLLYFRDAGALLSLNRAINNLNTEVTERINNTPVKAAAMLPEIMEDGTVTADFSYSNSILGSWFSSDISGNVKLASNTIDRDFALDARLNVFGGNYDLDAYIDRERLALRLQLLGDSFYGITYETFRDDIRVFGKLLRLSDRDMDMYADIVDQISSVMNMESQDKEINEAYMDVFSGFIGNLSINSSRMVSESTDKKTNRIITIFVSKDDLVALFNDLYDIFENDKGLQEQLNIYGSSLFQILTDNNLSNHDYFLTTIKDIIDNFERSYSGDIKLMFFIGEKDRLVRFVINSDIEYNGENLEYGVTFDFGNSITDTWMFSFWTAKNNDIEMLSINWSYDDFSETYINTVLVTATDMAYTIFSSEWNKDNGNYIFSYDDGYDTYEIVGNFTLDDTSFRLMLHDISPANSDSNFTISILAEPGAQIDKINYINIDKWGNALLESVIRLIFGFIF